jgi:hypothetical protein
MQILDRVISNVNICGVEFSFTGKAIPSNIVGWQPFYNSTFDGATFEKAYAGLASLEFGEESITTAPGTAYKQKIVLRFPNSDLQRSERIALMQKIKFVKLNLNNGLSVVIGRNDFNQNKTPDVKIKSNEQLCEVEIESQSIFPAGLTPNFDRFGLPVFIPLSF